MRDRRRWACALVLVLIPFSALAQQVVGQSQGPSFGTDDTTYVSVGHWEFVGAGALADIIPLLGGDHTKSCLNPGTRLQGPVDLPGGALLTYLELNSCDADPAADMTLKLYDLSTLNVNNSTLATISTSGSAGCANLPVDLAPLNYTVDNKAHRLLMEVSSSTDPEQGCLLNLRGAVIGYKLQVSPGPATATFNDVATSHPFFQFVEALAASGITVGCGSGNYCPDNPMTRGQMAVFLAKALGLNWSQ